MSVCALCFRFRLYRYKLHFDSKTFDSRTKNSCAVGDASCRFDSGKNDKAKQNWTKQNWTKWEKKLEMNGDKNRFDFMPDQMKTRDKRHTTECIFDWLSVDI